MITINQILDSRIKPKDWRGQPVKYKQKKKDGWRMSILMTPDGYRAIGRKGEYDLTGTPVEDTIGKLPDWSVLEGELYVPDVAATSVITAINEKWDTLRFDTFGIPFWRGDDRRFDLELQHAEMLADDVGIPFVETTTIGDPIDNWQHYANTLEAHASLVKEEGFVLKAEHYEGWYKVKPQKSLDLIVVGSNEGKDGKFVDMVGSIDVGFFGEDTRLARCSGMNDATRDEITAMRDAGTLIGRVVEVSYQSVAAKGGLQFPQFVRWREDKPAAECTRDQLKC